MLAGWKKMDPPTIKKLPVAIDVPELLSAVGRSPNANELDRAIGDLTIPSKQSNSGYRMSPSSNGIRRDGFGN